MTSFCRMSELGFCILVLLPYYTLTNSFDTWQVAHIWCWQTSLFRRNLCQKPSVFICGRAASAFYICVKQFRAASRSWSSLLRPRTCSTPSTIHSWCNQSSAKVVCLTTSHSSLVTSVKGYLPISHHFQFTVLSTLQTSLDTF